MVAQARYDDRLLAAAGLLVRSFSLAASTRCSMTSLTRSLAGESGAAAAGHLSAARHLAG
jgi:hypothetical protein